MWAAMCNGHVPLKSLDLSLLDHVRKSNVIQLVLLYYRWDRESLGFRNPIARKHLGIPLLESTSKVPLQSSRSYLDGVREI